MNSKASSRLTQAALAKALRISPARIVALKRQGMPIESVEGARRWREANVRQQIQMRPQTGWNHPAEPEYGDDEEDDETRAFDGADVFENIALAAHRHPERHVYSLLHVLPLLDDAQYQRVRSSGCVTQRVWEAIGAAWRELYER